MTENHITMDRKEEIRSVAAEKYKESDFRKPNMFCFIEGAEWADANPLKGWNKFSDDNMPEKGDLIVLAVADEKFGVASYELMKFDPIVIAKPYRDDVLWYPIPQLLTADRSDPHRSGRFCEGMEQNHLPGKSTCLHNIFYNSPIIGV